MSNLKIYKTVWVVIEDDPSVELTSFSVGVYESEATALETLEELMNDAEKPEHVRYYVEEVPMYLS